VSKWVRAELWQHEMMVACVEGRSKAQVEREINHYAFMYGQDGPCEIKWSEPMHTQSKKGKHK